MKHMSGKKNKDQANHGSASADEASSFELLKVMLNELRPGWILPKNKNVAQFKARVQELGRIAIPEAEREVIGLHKGDIVQVILWKT